MRRSGARTWVLESRMQPSTRDESLPSTLVSLEAIQASGLEAILPQARVPSRPTPRTPLLVRANPANGSFFPTNKGTSKNKKIHKQK